MTFHQAFYQKHGIKVTDEPINGNKSAEQTKLEVSIGEAVVKTYVSLQTVKLAEQAVDKYPNSEALKNYLYIAYAKTGQSVKALNCLHNTVKLHPNYAFGTINLVNYYLEEGKIDKAAELINEPYDVYRIENEAFIHQSVFISYYQAVVRLALAKKDSETAEKYHRMMFEYDSTNAEVRELAKEIFKSRLSNMGKFFTHTVQRTVKATQKAIVGWETSDKPPVFIHPEVQQLFTYSLEGMPKKIIQDILSLPRETLIQDLDNVLADMIRRRDMYLSLDDWNEDTLSFPIHALYFLTELRAYDRLPTVLNLLRQDQDFLDYWFSDGLNEYFLPTMYLLGKQQLPLLKDFVLEPDNYHWSRGLATEAAAQIALRQPERRAEVVQFFKDIAQAHLDQPDNDRLIDSNLLGSMLNDMLNFEAIELEQEIIALFQKGWISDGECGSLEEVLTELHQPEDRNFSRIAPLPASIFEMYSGKYTDRVERKIVGDSALNDKLKDPYNDFLMGQMFGGMPKPVQPQNVSRGEPYRSNFPERPSYQSQETVRRVEPKIGRNDPCHCGSGKKYKKCHGA
jgi:tetratricopeptide (TPR) repeat protein